MDNKGCEGQVITLKAYILIQPTLLPYINNSYYCKVIFPLLYFQRVPAGDGKENGFH